MDDGARSRRHATGPAATAHVADRSVGEFPPIDECNPPNLDLAALPDVHPALDRRRDTRVL